MLKEILDYKRREVATAKETLPLSELKDKLSRLEPRRNFRDSLRPRDGVRVIAEVKKASPSRGVIRHAFDPVELAGAYTRGGAAAISVLTDSRFFQGQPGYLALVRKATPLPLLRKDFIIDEYQLYESCLLGADAVLLIVAALTPAQLGEYLHIARGLGLAALVEVHTATEVKIALDAGAEIIGINNRDLQTFEVDLRTTLELRPLIPGDRMVVSESGIKTRRDIELLAAAGIDAVLVGEALSAAQDVEGKVRELAEAKGMY
ncbi:MAG: indole-3-glycerol phosphate synthase [Clostridia bacterium]|nr:indole-3-glycerol phosphate synthase [Clostridia bacterium]